MALQSTNRVKISKVRETTFGVTPTNPAFKAIRETSSSLAANPKTVITSEIRGDRQVTDLILVDQDAGGDVGGEVAFGVADDDIEEALQGTWSTNPVIVVATLDTEISDLSATVATVAAGGAAFVVGMLTLLAGFPTVVNNKLARVSSSTATTITYPAASFAVETTPIPVGAAIRTVGFEGVSGDLAAVTAGGNGLSSTTLDFTTFGLAVGRWIKLGDGDNAGHSFAIAACNGFCRISAISAHKLSFDVVPAGWVADTGAAVAVRAFIGDAVVNGSNLRTSTIERQYLDHQPLDYEYFTGQALNVLAIDAKQAAIATYTKTYLGKTAAITSARAAGATDVAAPTFGVLNTSSNVGRIGFNGSAITGPNSSCRRRSTSTTICAHRRRSVRWARSASARRVHGDGKAADLFRRRLGLQPDPEQHADVFRHAARPQRRQSRDAAVRFPGDQAVVRLASGLRQEPGRDDRCRLPGRHARHAWLHHAGAALLLPADLVGAIAGAHCSFPRSFSMSSRRLST
jgi:hypothetical protein